MMVFFLVMVDHVIVLLYKYLINVRLQVDYT